MKKQYRFINGIAFLLAFGLIVGLLPSLAAAQDLSTLEKRAAWLTGQFSGASIGSNAKFGATAALARLALNPDDAYPVFKSPSVTVADGVMRLATPAGRLEVDWRGKAPTIRKQ